MWVCNSVLFWRVKSRSSLTSLISVPSRQCFWEPGDVKIRLGLSVYCLKVFPWLISEHWRSLRQLGECLFCQAVGCPYLHWVSWLWVVSCGLHNRTFSLSLLSLSFFSPEIIGALGVNPIRSTAVIPAVLHHFLSSSKLSLCVHSCHSVLMCYVCILLHSWRVLWVRGVIFLSDIIYWTFVMFFIRNHVSEIIL